MTKFHSFDEAKPYIAHHGCFVQKPIKQVLGRLGEEADGEPQKSSDLLKS